jgi:protein-S-isoprenylcysteine O-methyltransferase Ste14
MKHTVATPLSETPATRHLRSVRSVFGFRHRGWIGVMLFGPAGTAAIFSTPMIAPGSLPGVLLTAAGWCAFLAYVVLRVWATMQVGGRKERELQTEGPYSLCRNPLYLGSFAFAVAMACFLKSLTFAALLIPAFLVYLYFVVRAEEHFLELRFQEDFRNYCRRTPRFWPRWAAYHTPAIVRVDVGRLKREAVRLACAALFVIGLQVLEILRASPQWPHWFPLP